MTDQPTICPVCEGADCPYCGGPDADYHTACIPCEGCSARRWEMWAGYNPLRGIYEHPGPQWYVAAYGHTPVPVTLIEDPDGPYWAWLTTRHGASSPEMVRDRRDFYDMQFTYGPDAEEAKGLGRTIRVRIEPKETP